MKNNMGLIMESWRSSKVLKEAAPYSDDVLNTITVGQFFNSVNTGDFRTSVDSKANKALEIFKRQFPEAYTAAVRSVPGANPNDPSGFEKLWPKIYNGLLEIGADQGLMGTLGGFLFGSIKVDMLVSSILVPAGMTTAAAITLAPYILGLMTLLGLGWGLLSLKKLTQKTSLDNIKALDVEDQIAANQSAAQAYDVSKDTKAVIYGPDKQLDKAESAALAAGHVHLRNMVDKISDEFKRIRNDPSLDGTQRTQKINDLNNTPLKQFGFNETVNTVVRKAYGGLIKLQNNVEIPKP